MVQIQYVWEEYHSLMLYACTEHRTLSRNVPPLVLLAYIASLTGLQVMAIASVNGQLVQSA